MAVAVIQSMFGLYSGLLEHVPHDEIVTIKLFCIIKPLICGIYADSDKITRQTFMCQ